MLLVYLFALLLNPTPKMIYNFEKQLQINDWMIVNDGVMGGLSESSLKYQNNGIMRFAGVVSLDNYGGFASTRTRPQDYQLGSYNGMTIRLKGDGKRYKFRIRSNDNFDGISYTIDIETEAGQWQDHRFLFSDMQATFRGRIFPDYSALEASSIRQIGFLIADKQEGPFKLEVDWIQATRL